MNSRYGSLDRSELTTTARVSFDNLNSGCLISETVLNAARRPRIRARGVSCRYTVNIESKTRGHMSSSLGILFVCILVDVVEVVTQLAVALVIGCASASKDAAAGDSGIEKANIVR